MSRREHIVLGSGEDGATSIPVDISQIIYLPQALLDSELTEQQIRQVMGQYVGLFIIIFSRLNPSFMMQILQ